MLRTRAARALGHECGSRPRATRCQSASMHGQVGAALFIHMRPHGIMTDQPKLPARPVGRQAEGLRPRATPVRAGARRGAGEGPYCRPIRCRLYCRHPWGRYRLKPAAEAAREEDAAQPQVVLALESLRAHHRGTAALIRAIEERVERHIARDERGEPAEEARSAIRTHLVKGRD